MLTRLKISHFALIDDLDLSLDSSFIALIGETGAGKSILIDAISLLSGSKSSLEKIRTGEDKAFIEGTFILKSQVNENFISELIGKELSSHTLIISRTIDKNNHNTIKINNASASLTLLRKVMDYVIDIHSQQKDAFYLHSENQLNLLDLYLKNKSSAEEKKIFTDYHDEYFIYQQALKEKKEKEEQAEQISDEETLKKNIAELENLHIAENEMEDLEKRRESLSNFERTSDTLIEFLNYYDNAKDSLYSAKKALSRIDDEEIESLKNQFEEAYYDLDDSYSEIKNIFESAEDKKRELEEVKDRLFTLHGLRRKYGYTTADILDSLNKMKEQLLLIEDYQSAMEKINTKIFLSEKKLVDLSMKITAIRQKYSLDLSSEINKTLVDLDFKNALFRIDFFKSEKFNLDGNDDIVFMLRANEGERFLMLDKTASLGESSRLNFALKYVFNKLLPKDVIIFDEIDVGVSGKVGISLGKKMRDLSVDSQVILISHLPALVAQSKQAYEVKKVSENGRTYSLVHPLSDDEKIVAMAKMIAGEVTEEAIEAARSLISK